jgi:F-type H+-transporting ATPase subunit gamma
MSRGLLRTLKKRIDSTYSTMKITRAMEMVARAKLSKIRYGLDPIIAYEKELKKSINYLHKKVFLGEKIKTEENFLIIVSTDMGLCGGFNSELFRKVNRELSEKKIAGIISVGLKAENYFKNSKLMRNSFSKFFDVPTPDDAEIIINTFYEDKDKDKKDYGLLVAYNEFKNPLVQVPTIQRILPYDVDDSELPDDVYDFEPYPEKLFEDLEKNWIISKVLLSLFESKYGELYARQNSMKTATDNAKDLIDSLTLLKNKVRQSNITQEITEVVSGANALKS